MMNVNILIFFIKKNDLMEIHCYTFLFLFHLMAFDNLLVMSSVFREYIISFKNIIIDYSRPLSFTFNQSNKI